jgi:nucleotide-binding universal stress UspA family protein
MAEAASIGPMNITRIQEPPTIGVAYVEGAAGRESLRAAYGLASSVDAQLRIITVVQPSLRMHASVRAATPAADGTDIQDVEGERQMQLDHELTALVASLGDFVAVEISTSVGDPAQTLIDASENLDLLVCGSRGQGPIRSAVLGSVSQRVTAEAHCPVLVLPPNVVAPVDRLTIGVGNTPTSTPG